MISLEKRNKLKAYVNCIMWYFVVVIYTVSQQSLCTCLTDKIKTASFIAFMLQGSLQARGGHLQYLL
jgi:hypothetical protein